MRSSTGHWTNTGTDKIKIKRPGWKNHKHEHKGGRNTKREAQHKTRKKEQTKKKENMSQEDLSKYIKNQQD